MTGLNEFIDRLDLKKLSLRERVLAVITAAAVLLAFMVYFLLPARQEVLGLRAQKTSLQAQIDQGNAAIPLLQTRLEEEAREAQAREISDQLSGKVGDLLPGGQRLSAVLEELTRLARFRKIDFVAIRPDSILDKGSYLELTLQIDVKSRFQQLGDYLRMLENLPRAIVVKDLKIETRADISPFVQTRLETVTFLGKE